MYAWTLDGERCSTVRRFGRATAIQAAMCPHVRRPDSGIRHGIAPIAPASHYLRLTTDAMSECGTDGGTVFFSQHRFWL